MKSLWLCVSLFTFCHSAFGSSIGMELLPRHRPFRLTFADPREVKMSLDFEGDNKINAAIGNYFSIFAVRPVEPGSWEAHFGLEGAGYFTMHKANDRFPLETADGVIGAYVEGKIDIYQWQVRFGHTSAHLADGIAPTGDGTPYSREYINLRAGIVPISDLQVYGGMSYLINMHPAVDRWIFQTGVNAFVPSTSQFLVPYIGTDIKWKQDTVFNPCFSMQLGLALNNPPEAYRSFRFFYRYYTGADPRGQFYNELITSHSLGLEMQI